MHTTLSNRRAQLTIPRAEPEPGLEHHLEHDVEMSWAEVDGEEYLTPNDRFFVRSHGASPAIDPETWKLRIEGPGARRPIDFGYDELLRMPAVTVVKALECAGNGRTFFASSGFGRPRGHQWGLGAIGVAAWSGVPLRDLLDRAGLTPAATEVVPEGLDEPRVRRPLPRRKAMDDETLIALAMNGDVLPVDHGFPARLIVPGWAAVASIKWLGRILVPDRPTHTGWITDRYVLRGPRYSRLGPSRGITIEEQVGKSALELPRPARLPAKRVLLRGRSWSPDAGIERVDVSVDGGRRFRPAMLREPNLPGAWVRWVFEWEPHPGRHHVQVRATDTRGVSQPRNVPWNDGGYLYGGVVTHPVEITPAA